MERRFVWVIGCYMESCASDVKMERLLHPEENLHLGDQSVTFSQQIYGVCMRNTSSNASAPVEKLYVLVCQMKVHRSYLYPYMDTLHT